MKWSDKNKKSVLDLGAPLGKTMRVTPSGMSPTKNEITGFTVVEADDFDSAAKMFKDHPHLKMKGAYVDILEYFPMQGM
jgi:hypothetical protein